MRLIDADNLQKYDWGHLKEVSKEALFLIETEPTIEAIPIEWINDYLWHIMTTNKITSVEERSLKMMGIKDMLFVWEHLVKENEQNKENAPQTD